MSSSKDMICFICCSEDPASTSFTDTNAKILCRLLSLPFSYFQDFKSVQSCQVCTNSISTFAKLFEQLDELGKRLDDGRKLVEEQLNQNLVNNKYDEHNELRWRVISDLNKFPSSSNTEKKWLLDELQNGNSRAGIIHPPFEVIKDKQSPSADKEPPNLINSASMGGFNEDEEDEFGVGLPPSPTGSFGSILSFEEKFEPIETSNITVEAGIQSSSTNETTTSSKNEKRGRQTCPFTPSCGKYIIVTDEIGVDAHFQRYHRGKRLCYICKFCRAGFCGYVGLKDHYRVRHPNEYKEEDFLVNNVESSSKDLDGSEDAREEEPEEVSGTNSASNSSTTPIKKSKKIHKTRIPCPFIPACEKFINRDDEISRDAHYLRYHEGVSNQCYVCKFCPRTFSGYADIKRHLELQHSNTSYADPAGPLTEDLLEDSELLKAENGDDSIGKNHSDNATLLLGLCEDNLKIANSPYPKISIPRLNQKVVEVYTLRSTAEMKPKSKRKFNPGVSGGGAKRPRLHYASKRVKCPVDGCKMTFWKTEEHRRKAHVRKKHEGAERPFECEVCPLTFKVLERWETHNATHTGIPVDVCKICSAVCSSACTLRNHMSKEHGISRHKKSQLKCKICGKVFEQRYRLGQHERLVHQKERPYLCEICSLTFTSAQYLKHHMSTHEDSSVHPYKCPDCGKHYGAPSNLRAHIRRAHTNVYKCVCEECGYGAQCESELQRHKRNRHSEDKPYKCPHCPSSFRTKENLTPHLKRHTGVRNYKCTSCGKAFIDKAACNRHELIHSKEQCHECKVCGKTFPVRGYLYIHMRSHDKSKWPPKENRKKMSEIRLKIIPNLAVTLGLNGGEEQEQALDNIMQADDLPVN